MQLAAVHASSTGGRLLLSLGVCAGAVALRFAVVAVVRGLTHKKPNERAVFWTRQAAALSVAVLLVVGLLAVWVEDTARLATVGGLIGAGVAFALQKVITAFAGYLVILRGRTFTVGDRITMGGVRGDVISLGFLQTRILEMGEPPAVQTSDNRIWIHARQYTGRVVTVTNDKLFDQPVCNFTREFPYMWEEIRIPVPYKADRRRAEAILLECARKVTDPEVHGVRFVKDQLYRMVLDRFEAEGLEIASSTFGVVELPPVKVHVEAPERAPSPSR